MSKAREERPSHSRVKAEQMVLMKKEKTPKAKHGIGVAREPEAAVQSERRREVLDVQVPGRLTWVSRQRQRSILLGRTILAA